MKNRIDFGKLFEIKDCFDTLPKFYHIHRVKPDFPRWKVGVIKSSRDIDKRDSPNPSKKIRERVFEELRKLKFSDYPSRDQCLFVIKESEIKVWLKYLINGCEYYQILEIELLNGKFIELDESFFDYDDTKFEYKSDTCLAHHYWEADSIEGNRKPVFLFEGKFEVKEIINEKSYNLLFNK